MERGGKYIAETEFGAETPTTRYRPRRTDNNEVINTTPSQISRSHRPPPPSYDEALGRPRNSFSVLESDLDITFIDEDETPCSNDEDFPDDGTSERTRRLSEARRKSFTAMRKKESQSSYDSEEMEMMDVETSRDRPPMYLDYIDLYDASPQIRETSNDASIENGENPEDEERPTDFECKGVPLVYPLFTAFGRAVQRAMRAWPGLPMSKKLFIVACVLLAVGSLLTVALLPASFSYVDYDKMAFRRNKVTWKIDYSQVYTYGCYLLAPQDHMVEFKSTAHFYDRTFSVFNYEGLTIKIRVMLQYFLRPHELSRLFQSYHYNYPDVIDLHIENTIKNTAVSFSLDEYRLERRVVEAHLHAALAKTLSGDCCPSCCPSQCSNSTVCLVDRCVKPQPYCSRGVYVDLRYFQLGELSVPADIMERFMRREILKLEAEKEMLYQEKALIVKETELMVADVKNQAKEIIEQAKAESRLILVTAEADKLKTVELAYQKALAKMFSRLNMTSQDDRISLMFVRGLEDSRDKLTMLNQFSKSSLLNV